MKQFIDNVLHQRVEIEEYNEMNKIPLSLKGKYNLRTLNINGQSCVLVEPKEEIRLVELRKDQRRLQQLTEQYCVLCFANMKEYPREKMLEEGIPFIWKNHQIYMPFIGILLKQNEARNIRPCTKVSFLTQKMLLTALYDQWKKVTVTEAAIRLGVSKMSVTRCYDEIESLNIPLLHRRGRTRMLSCELDKRATWNAIKKHMRNPLLEEFYLEEDNVSKGLLKSGISALAQYSMLEDNKYGTYAITKAQLAECNLNARKQVPFEESPGCVVQKLGYVINYKNEVAVDPLTVLMLMKSERTDPRVEKALEEMLEEFVW